MPQQRAEILALQADGNRLYHELVAWVEKLQRLEKVLDQEAVVMARRRFKEGFFWTDSAFVTYALRK